MSIAAFLVAMVGPLLLRIISSLGVSLIVLTGLVEAVAALKNQVVSDIGALPTATIQLAGLLGIWSALGIFFGAMTFVITWRSTKGFIALAKA